ncbi:MAG: hypothetical protein JNJ59_12860 [Deltaproteobacteria bacterium]|nr:hypothetical protein [Deltaproteobacteria bacterium]
MSAPEPIIDHGHGDSRLLVRTPYTTTFAHMGEVYLYHDLYGYIIKMSPDILDFLNAFKTPVRPDEVCKQYANAFEEQTPEAFVGVFLQFGCLIKPDHDQVNDLWDMIPVHGSWNVWKREKDGGLTFYCCWGDNPLTKVTLTPDEAKVWWSIDGEKTLKTIQFDEQVAPEVVLGAVKKLGHHEVQALKLSALGMRFYKKRPQMKPPYLTSTMPYAKYEPGVDALPAPVESYFSPEGYYRGEIADADQQFDHEETTLAHLFRIPHPALHGKTYGQALTDALIAKGRVPEGHVKVLEIGGGLGFMAKAMVEALQAKGREVTYHIFELSPVLAAAQRERNAGLPVTVHMGDVLNDAFPDTGYDLVLANEMIGDLFAVKLDHARFGLGEGEIDDAKFEAGLDASGVAGALIRKYGVPIGDAPDPFYLNIGAWQLCERLIDVMKPGASAWITEFGDMGKWPLLSTHLDHPELSIHFGHLGLVAKQIGFDADFEFVMDTIEMRRDLEGLKSTRSYFKALGFLLAEYGVKLEKIGYTRPMFTELLEGKVQPGEIGDIGFDRIEDRLMGLVPHEFKALIIRKPVKVDA